MNVAEPEERAAETNISTTLSADKVGSAIRIVRSGPVKLAAYTCGVTGEMIN